MTCFPLAKSAQNRTGHPQANRHTPVLLTCETRPHGGDTDDCRVGEDDYSSGEQRKYARNDPTDPMWLHGRCTPPNGSRLSCGASAGGRKRPALRYELAGAQTSASSESRPRQLQALVRQRRFAFVRTSVEGLETLDR